MEPLIDKGIRIDLPFSDLKDRTVVEFKECYLMLLEEFLQYKIVVDYIDKSDDIPLDKKANFRWTRRRDDLSDVAMFYDNTDEKWALSIEFRLASSSNMTWMYDNPKDALKVYTQLSKYLMRETT